MPFSEGFYFNTKPARKLPQWWERVLARYVQLEDPHTAETWNCRVLPESMIDKPSLKV